MLLIADAAGSEEQGSLPERRRGLRIRQNRPIKVFEPSADRYFPGQTEDISSARLRIKLPAFAPIRPGRLLNVHVGHNQSDAFANRRHMIPARVIWIDRQSEVSSGRLLAGLEFLARAAAVVDAA